jgi:oligopeptide/dipeptide ABC transporter ATP-binding protein
MIVGLERPTSGSVVFAGRDISKPAFRERRRLHRERQFVFQDPYASLDPRMRVGAIVGEPLAAQHIGSRTERRETVRRLLDEVGLPRDAVNRYPHEFSGGQRQRLGLARALALNPRLIVADEPVSALDVSIRSQVLNLMRELQRRHDLTYIVISHDLTVVRYISDLIGVMYLGKLVEVGQALDVYERAAHPYTAALIATIPLPDPVRERAKSHASIRGELPSAIDPPTGCRFHTRCPLAQELCRTVEPPLRPFGSSHVAACHFPLQEPLEPRAAA